jgi:hypothetical protein
MWFLNFIPDNLLHWFVHGVVALGIILSVVGVIAKLLPFIKPYGVIAKSIGALLLLVGIFFEGGYGVEMSWRARVNEMQAKIDAAEKQSTELKQQLQTASQQKTIIIKQKVIQNAKDIETKREVINSGCTINDDAWLFYNRAVAPKLPDSTR